MSFWWRDYGEKKTTLAAFIGVGPILPSSILPYNYIIHSSVESNFVLIGDAAVALSRPKKASPLCTSPPSVLSFVFLTWLYFFFFCFIYPLQQQYKVVNLDLGAWSSRPNSRLDYKHRIENVAFFLYLLKLHKPSYLLNMQMTSETILSVIVINKTLCLLITIFCSLYPPVRTNCLGQFMLLGNWLVLKSSSPASLCLNRPLCKKPTKQVSQSINQSDTVSMNCCNLVEGFKFLIAD